MDQQNVRDYLGALNEIESKLMIAKNYYSFIFSNKTKFNEIINRDKLRIEQKLLENFYNETVNVVDKIEKIIEQSQIVKSTIESGNTSEQYVEYLNRNLLHINWGNFYYLSEHQINRINHLEQTLQNDGMLSQELYGLIDMISDFIRNHKLLMNTFIGKISSLQIFNQIQQIENNLVIIGPNGSGKSTFARYLDGKISDNVTIISAQHLLVYSNPRHLNIEQESLEKVRLFQRLPKLEFDSNSVSELTKDLENLMLALFEEKIQRAVEYYEEEQNKSKSVLDQTIEVWQGLISHRKLIHNRNYNIHVETLEGEQYEFNNLSDGEKTIFYFIGHILLATENSYIIIDEPENHLHLSICIRLWDTLEKLRKDCKFIYITHDLDFAVTRNEKKFVWNKHFNPPFEWDFQIIENESDIPERLLIEVMGSRKSVLFCEGDDRNSLDFKIYNVILGDKFNVIPVGGHDKVISYTKSFNENEAVGRMKAYGIIDGDAWDQEKIERFKASNVYVLPFNEIENVMCLEDFVRKICELTVRNLDSIQDFKLQVIEYANNNKEKLAVWYANNQINNYLKHNLFKETKDIEKLKEEMENTLSIAMLEEYYNQMLERIQKDLEDENFEALIKYINGKKYLTRGLGNKFIINDYEETFIRLLDRDNDFKQLFIEKVITPYFSELMI